MRDRRNEFGDAEVAVVTFADPRVLAGFRRRFVEPLTVLSDKDRVEYRSFGLGRGPWYRVWGWRTIKEYGRLLRDGMKMERPAADSLQLGGDFVIDRAGRLAWSYPSARPDDRPSVDELLAAVRSC